MMIWSLAYVLTVLMYFLRGALSWQGLKAATKEQKYNHIMEKMTTPTDLLCRGFPNKSGIFLSASMTIPTTHAYANSSVTSPFANLVAFSIGVSNEAPSTVLAKRLLLVGAMSSKRKA
jgi:hypothetical protein